MAHFRCPFFDPFQHFLVCDSKFFSFEKERGKNSVMSMTVENGPYISGNYLSIIHRIYSISNHCCFNIGHPNEK